MSALDALAGFTFLRLLLGGGQTAAEQPAAPSTAVPLSPLPSLDVRPVITPSTPVAPTWPSSVPPTLPPFPGDAWEPDQPVPTPVVQRAVALVPQLWGQGEGTHTFEMTAGHWVAYLAQLLNGKHGVTAWRLKSPAAAAAAAKIAPSAAPLVPLARTPAPVTAAPPPAVVLPPAPLVVPAAAPSLVAPAAPELPMPTFVSPYPAPGAYASNVSYIRKYQLALTWLAGVTRNRDWDPGYQAGKAGSGVDGKFGPSTQAGVLAFQKFNGLKPVDGKAGAVTAAAIDHWLTAQGLA